MNCFRFSSGPPRRQNFFELNPIYPDRGQKDFDIYNADYKHVITADLTISDEARLQQVKQKLIKDVYLGPVLQKNYDATRGQYQLDEESGFPIGMHEDFDTFIQKYKLQKKVGSNVVGQFEDLVMSLMKKFEAKTELQLIKIFRFNIANAKKTTFKDKIRSLMINSAFIRFINERKSEGKSNETLTLADLDQYANQDQAQGKRQNKQISQEELNQVVVLQTLKQLDLKIAQVEEQIKAKAIADGSYIPTFHHQYGAAIKEEETINTNYDLNYPRGFLAQISTNEPQYSPAETQDRYIQTKINKLFFAEVVKQIQSKKEIQPQKLQNMHNLPIHLRSKDRIINSLLYKYKEYDLLVEPDLSEIYNEIDMVFKKIAVKVVPDYLQNETDNKRGKGSAVSEVKERILTKDILLWRKLDVQEIFDPEHYNEDQVNKVKIEQKKIKQLSPSNVLQLSLNKMPFNLYRHADLDNFGVFNKYRKRIYQDYLSDKVIDPQIQFKFFSLTQAEKKLKKIKKPQELPDKYYGHAKRKSSQAQVFVTQGNGKVMINKEPLADYFGDVYHRGEALKPLIFTETAGKYDLQFNVVGGGIHSQSECLSLALTKALIMINPKHQKILAKVGLVGTDDRKKQPKRIGLYSARVRPPYVRR